MPRPLVLDAWLRRPLVVALSALALATLVGLTICAGLRQRYCPVGSARFQTRIILGRVQTAEERYAADHDGGCAPSLAALVDGHYLRRMPRDAWGHLLMYRCR
ncbi:MAG TPA: hypothetical protein VIA18_00430, partial [Polyangia bacterium]|nr:hypothetical protein [Polyangia bacterium]